MPTPKMTEEEQWAYDEALRRIEVCRLKRGTEIDLSRLGLIALPPQIDQLTALTTLGLHEHQLTSLPPEIGQLPALEGLFLHNNPGLGLPAEVLGPTLDDVVRRDATPKPPREILEYYFTHRQAAEESGMEPLMEAKVLVLGE